MKLSVNRAKQVVELVEEIGVHELAAIADLVEEVGPNLLNIWLHPERFPFVKARAEGKEIKLVNTDDDVLLDKSLDLSIPADNPNYKYVIVPKTAFSRLYRHASMEGCVVSADRKESLDTKSKFIEDLAGFKGWLTDWIEYEIAL
jgi:hypothetical protein